MSATEVIDEIKALPAPERLRVYQFLLRDPDLREDLLDSLTIAAREDEPSRPLAEVLDSLAIRT